MDKNLLRQIAREHLAKNPLDPRIQKLLNGFMTHMDITDKIDDPNTTAKSLEQYLLQTRDTMKQTYALCQESGEISRQDFLRYMKSAEELIPRLYKALPLRKR